MRYARRFRPSAGLILALTLLCFVPRSFAVYGQLDHFTVEMSGGGLIGTQVAGTAFDLRITARQTDSSVFTTFTGTVTISDTTGTISPTASNAFTAGILDPQSATITKAQSGVTITVTCFTACGIGGQTGTSNSFTVDPAITVGAPTLGTPFFAPNFVTSATGLASTISGNLNTSSCKISVDGSSFAVLSGTCATPTTSTTIGNAFTATGVAATDGPHTVSFQAADAFGNTVTSSMTSFTLDNTAPTISKSIPGSPTYPSGCQGGPPNCYVTSATTLRVNVTDSGSGVASCTITVTGPSGTTHPACAAGNNGFTLSGSDGTYTITATATDNVGSASSDPLTVVLDNTAPDSYSETLGSPNYANGGITYLKSTTSISVNANDGSGSGVASCTKTIDAGAPVTYILGTNFTLPTPDGAHSYTISCTDHLGNNSSFGNTRTIDDTPPTINAAEFTNSTCYPTTNCSAPPQTVPANTYVKARTQASPSVPATTFRYMVSDSGSGLASCTLSGTQQNGSYTPGNNFNIALGDGSKTFSVSCSDNLGNSSSNTSPSLIVDDTAPTINTAQHTNTTCYPASRCSSPPQNVQSGTYVKAQDQAAISPYPAIARSTFRYVVTDSGSGLASCTLSGTQQNGTYTQGTDFNIASGDGPKTFSITCTDNLGNQSSNTSVSLTVDDTAPTINTAQHTNTTCYPASHCSPAPQNVQTGTYVKALNQAAVSPYPAVSRSTFRYLVSDGSSGLQGCTLTAGTQQNGSYTQGNNFNIASGDGPKTFSIACADNLGNIASNTSPSLVVDDTAPTINNPEHTNTTCYPTANCATPPQTVQAGTYVKALNQAAVSPYPAVARSTFRYVASDSSSGLQSCNLTAGTQQNGTYTQGSDFNIASGDGTKTFSIACADNLGNIASNTSPSLIVDDTPPTINAAQHTNTTCYPKNRCNSPPQTVQANTYVKALDQAAVSPYPAVAMSTFRYVVTDGSSGLQSCTLTTGTQQNGSYTQGSDFNIASGDGAKTFSVACTDNLGNSSSNTSPTLVVDDTPPTIDPPEHTNTTCYPTGRCNPINQPVVSGTWVKALDQAAVSPYPAIPRSTFQYVVSDSGSGLQDCTLTSGTQQNGLYAQSTNFNIAVGDGAKTFSVACRDNLGNSSSNTSPSLIVDDTVPTITTPLHTNTTCWPLNRCSSAPLEAVVDNTWVKAVDKQPFFPSNPLLPAYPNFIPKSTFQFPEAGSSVDPTPIADPNTGSIGSGLKDCTLYGGTSGDGLYPVGFGAINFSFLPGDGSRTFTLACRDNLGNATSKARTLNVDDTPPTASFSVLGNHYIASDGVIFVESSTPISIALSDAIGVDLAGGPGEGPLGDPACKQNLDKDPTLVQPCETTFTFPPPDRDHHVWTIRPDSLGNVAESEFVFVVDDTAPQIKVNTPVEQAQYLLNETVKADWTVTDDISFFTLTGSPSFQRGSGIASVVATAPSGEPIDTRTVGAKAFSVSATDNLGHQNAVLITYQVIYKYALDPNLQKALDQAAFKAGDKIELRFSLGDVHDVPVTDAQPLISLIGPSGKPIDLGKKDQAGFDAKSGIYRFILDTAGLAADTYEIWIQPGDGATHKIKLVLK